MIRSRFYPSYLYRFGRLWGLLMLLSVLSQSILANTRLDTFDIQKKCVSEKAVMELASLPRDISQVTLPDVMNSLRVDETTMTGKTKNAYQQLRKLDSFYQSEFGWSSVDGNGAPILLLGNLAVDLGKGCSALNAFYANMDTSKVNIIAILYGHQSATEDLADDFGIIGHEFSHGIFNHAVGERVTVMEKRGINEGVSDMFGVAARAWSEAGQTLENVSVTERSFYIGMNLAKIAARYYQKPFKDGVMRNLSNPYPWQTADHYNQATMPENQEEHKLSGIVSLPFALMVAGGKHPRIDNGIQVEGIGMKKAIHIIFYAMKHRLPFNTMPQFADAIRKAARKMHGEDSAEYRAVDNAYAAVGLVSGDLPENNTEPEPEQEQEPAPQQIPPPVNQPAPQTGQGFALSGPFIVTLLACMLLAAVGAAVAVNKHRGAQKNNRSEPIKESSQPAMNPLTPNYPASSVTVVTLTSHQFTVTIPLTSDPILLGRGRHLMLPDDLKRQFMNDDYIGREHCEIWFEAKAGYLYLRCLSDNGVRLNGHSIKAGEKVKTRLDEPVKLMLGRTEVALC